MTAWLAGHKLPLGLVLLALVTISGAALVFGWGTGSAPAGALLVPTLPPAASRSPAPGTTPAGTGLAAATAVPLLQVYITGAVLHPGVYSVAEGSRVEDLLAAAGGPADDADLERLNLAARVRDEEQVVVPRLGTPGAAAPMAPNPPAAANRTPAGPININTADEATLEALPGIGPTLAGRIVAYRTAHGAFAQIEAIQDVPGIGPALFGRIRELIAVGP